MSGPVLSFVAGFVDTVGFVALFGLFTAHVTGNFVVIGAAFADPGRSTLLKWLALPTFVLAVAASHAWLGGRLAAGRPAVVPALGLEIALLAAFMLAGLAHPPASAGDAAALLTGLLGVAAMAVQNAASRTVFKELVPTTVMTGNTTQIVIDAVDRLRGAGSPALDARLRAMAPAVAAFAVGAMLGGLGIARVGFLCLGLPVLLLVGLAVADARR
jgi:uncharacterized membrane protein YoaK (UPF0700 family)